jgi:hypothetical protein
MNPDRYAPIGVFDSGLGGLTVVREIMRNLPDERLVYFGDTARVPYGSKSKATVIRYSRQIVRFLKNAEGKGDRRRLQYRQLHWHSTRSSRRSTSRSSAWSARDGYGS